MSILKELDKSIQEERNKRSMELFNKPCDLLELGEIDILDQYMYDLKNPVWKPLSLNNEETKYEISNVGNIRNTKTGHIMSYGSNKVYPSVTLTHNGKTISKMVHVLVAENFVEKPKDYNDQMVVNHKNCNKKIYYYQNLEWVTKSENAKHAAKNGLIKYKIGTDHGNNKFSEEQIREICVLLADNKHPREISNILNIPESLATSIKRRESWVHISSQYKIPKPGEIPKGPRLGVQKSKIYTPDVIHKVCKMLEEGKKAGEISKEINVNIGFVNDIKGRRIWTRYSSQYNIPMTRSNPNHTKPKFPKYNEMVKLLEDSNCMINSDDIIRKLELSDTPKQRKYINHLRFKIRQRASSTIGQLP